MQHLPGSVDDALSRLQQSLNARLKALSGEASPDAVHEARISIRRMRGALRALKVCFDLPVRKRHLKALRRLAQDLDPIREADTREPVIRELMERGAFIGPEQASQLLIVVTEQRERSRRELQQRVQTEVWKQRLSELERTGLEQSLAATMGSSMTAIGDLIARRRRRLCRALRHIDGRPRKLHRLRLRIKEIRYLEEDVGTLLHSPREHDLIQLRRLQNRLGEFHDNWCLRKWLRSQYIPQPIVKHLRVAIGARQAQLLKSIARLSKRVRKNGKSI